MVGFNTDIMGSYNTLCGTSGLAATAATLPEVYVGREYGKAVALGAIPRGPHMPLGFTGCGSDVNAIGSYADPC